MSSSAQSGTSGNIAHTDEHDLWPHYSRAWLALVERTPAAGSATATA